MSAVNKWKYKTKEPLDMFLVTFDSAEDINKIFEVKLILNTVVKIEPTKRSNLIPYAKFAKVTDTQKITVPGHLNVFNALKNTIQTNV